MIALVPARLHRRALTLAQKVRLAWWRWRKATVRSCMVLAFDSQERLLLVRHSYHQSDTWMLPGGGIARGEDPIHAGSRELAEETGCRLIDPIHFARHDSDQSGWTNQIELVCGQTADNPRCDGREIIAAEFFALDALPEKVARWTDARIAQWQVWRSER